MLPARGGLSTGHANEDDMNELITSSGAWYPLFEKGWEYFSLYCVSRASIESIV